MTRIPTTATYQLYLSEITKQKATINNLSYQVTTGNRYDSFDQYGLSTYRLLSLQNQQAITSKYIETNTITQIFLETQQSSVDAIRSTLTDIRSQVREFSSKDLVSMSENPTQEELSALQNIQEEAFEAMSLIAYYLNTQIDGNYIFGGGNTKMPPVDFPYTTLEEFQAFYDGKILTYPATYSASLSGMSTGADILQGVTVKQDFQTVAPEFYVCQGSETNAMTFENASNSLSADAGTFDGFQAGDQVVVTGTDLNDKTFTVRSVSANGSTIVFDEPVEDESLTDSKDVRLIKENWIFSSVKDMETGQTVNTLTAHTGTFSGLQKGEKILIGGTVYNNGYLTVKDISADGSTLTFEENVTDETINTEQLFNETVFIQQSTKTGTITAQNNLGAPLESFSCRQALTVDPETNTIMGSAGTFSNVSAGQTITITDNSGNMYALYVKSVSEDGSTLNISTSTPVPDTDLTNVPLTIQTRSDINGFICSVMKGSALQTGDISFNINQNSMTATVKGAFSSYKAGDSVIIKGADLNDRMYVIDSVSEDGRTIIFDETTKVAQEMSLLNHSTISGGKGISICKTYPVGATVAMTQAGEYGGSYTVLGVSDDGRELFVRTNAFPEYGESQFISTACFDTTTYYKGGWLSSSFRISDTTEIINDTNAASGAFEKIFRALGCLAQGNMLDPDNPENASQRVSLALNWLDEALTAQANGSNEDVTGIQYSIINKLDSVKTVSEDQTEMQNSLETYISSLTQVDKTEAATMLLQAAENLKLSYSVLSTINSLSLLNYL